MLRKTMLALAFASAALALVLLAVVGGKLSVSARTGGEARPTAFATQSAPAAIVGELAGTTADGKPVYRLPPITVATTRSAELARVEREERQAAASAARLPHTDVRAAVPGPVAR
jgi:hypothetical protein